MSADDRLCLLTVHAHPDDESSKGASTVAKYAQAGVRAVLVCCTGGELGDIANPAMDKPEVRENLAEVRRQELAAAAEIIGFHEVVMLGYRDSGMADSPGNADPASFHQAELDEAVGRLVAIIRRERPQVVLTYGDDQQGYPHPDHLKVHDITVPAFDRAGDRNWYPEAGDPWQPLKLYYSIWSRARAVAMAEQFVKMGKESPWDQKWFDRPWLDHRITTKIDIGDHFDVRNRALIAHATQIDPTSHWWFGMPDDEARLVYPHEDFILAKSLVDEVGGEDRVAPPAPGTAPEVREQDLFAGIRAATHA